MKKSTPLSERIKSYSLLSSAIIAPALACEAQVIYTDVDPDFVVEEYQPYLLDLNNDGITDFEIEYLYTGSGYWYSHTAEVNPASVNSIANSNGGIRVCDFGDNITSNLTWNDGANQSLANRWRDGTQILWFLTDFGSTGNWINEHEKYMALRFTFGGEQYYGWVRLSVVIGYPSAFTVHDYAYSASPQVPIMAGCIGDTLSVFRDADEDGYGDAAISSSATDCIVINGYVYDSTDCNDTNASIHPGVIEVINSVDDDCNGIVDADFWMARTGFGGTNRHSATGFSIGTKGYLGMGVNRDYDFQDVEYKDFWEYDPTANTWTQKADFAGTARHDAVGFSIGNKGYVGTGYSDYNVVYNDFWEYDPNTNTWTQKADFGGTPRSSAIGFSIGNKGYTGTGASGFPYTYYNDFWEYDSNTNTWTQKADFGGTPRASAIGFSIGNKGYVGTGTADSFKKDFWEYYPPNDSWTQKTDFAGEARSSATEFSIGNKGYIGTGITTGGYKNDFWEYDAATDSWTEKTDFAGIERPNAVGFSIANKGYIGTGGIHGGYYDFFYFYNDFWEYTPCLQGSAVYADADGDGYGTISTSYFLSDCTIPEGYVANSDDCDDANGSVNPLVSEICNGIDDDCDSYTDVGIGQTFYADSDNDSYGNALNTTLACNLPFGYVADSTDCDDMNASVNPLSPEVCNGLDDNCNLVTDEGWIFNNYFADADGDSFGNPDSTTNSCVQPAGYVTDKTDCDDSNALINPSATEVCDNTDNNCNSIVDEGFMLSTWYADNDGDNYGTTGDTTLACMLPQGYINDSTDCDDNNTSVNPGAPEIPNNSIDDDCDGYLDEFGTGIFSSANTASVFSLFPNPTNDEFVVYLQLHNELNAEANIEVINLLGQVVYHKTSALVKGRLEEAIKLSDEADGMYLVRVMVNEQLYSRRIVLDKQ